MNDRQATLSLIILLGLFSSGVCAAQDSQAQPALPVKSTSAPQTDASFPTFKRRLLDYAERIAGPAADIGIAAKATAAQAANHPAGWGQDSGAFGKRLGWWWAENWISETARFAASESFRLDATYHRSAAGGAGARIRHALKESFVARTRSGRTILSVPSLAAPYVGAMYGAYAWYPGSPDWKQAVKAGSITLAFQPAVSLLREFVFKR